MKKIVADQWHVEEKTQLDSLTIAQGAKLTASDGKVVMLTVDGALTEAAPGEYAGKIVVEAVEPVTKLSDYENEYISVLTVDGGVKAEQSALSAITGAEISDGAIKGGKIAVKAHKRNGITIKSGSFRIEGTEIEYEANGANDFQLYGTAIATADDAKVVIDNAIINTRGVIATAVASGGKSEVLIKDSKINCVGADNANWHTTFPHLTEVPWVLGLRGTLRSTNVIDDATVTYYNSYVESNGWGVLSTDATERATHNIINTKAVIKEDSDYGSGYAVYILHGTSSTFLGVEFDVPDYAFSVGGADADFIVGASSKENLEEKSAVLGQLKSELGGSFDAVEQRNSVIRAKRYGGMWHHQVTGTMDVRPGTVIQAGECAFYIKSGERINAPKFVCDGALIDSPMIIHLMENDDPGMGERGHDGCWAPVGEFIFDYSKDAGFDVTDAALETTVNGLFKNMAINGDFYNTRIHGQNMALVFDNAAVNSVISSGKFEHNRVSYYVAMDGDEKILIDEAGKRLESYVDAYDLFGKIPVSYVVPTADAEGKFISADDGKTYAAIGYGIYNTDPEFLGDVTVTAEPTINNGVIVRLENGSVWTAKSTSYITGLTVGEGCAVKAPEGKRIVMTADGVVMDIVPGVEYKGAIVIEVIDEMLKVSDFENDYRSGVVVEEAGVVRSRSALSSVIGGELTNSGLKGGEMVIKSNCFNGVTINNGKFRVDDVKFTYEANGGDDFELYGGCVITGNKAEVVVNNCDFSAKGVIASAVAAGGDSRVLVKDCNIYTEGTDNSQWHTKFPHLTQVPWGLGLKGTLRSSNILDAANVIFYNTVAESNGWGVLSTDFVEGAVHTIINTTAKIDKHKGFGSGYGAYALADCKSSFLGIDFDVPDYALALGGSESYIIVGPSSRENLELLGESISQLKAELGGSFDAVEERPSTLRSGRFVGMWHHTSTGTVDFKPGTTLEAGDTAFLIKSGTGLHGPANGKDMSNRPVIICDGVKLAAPTVMHVMESDDPGMGVRGHDKCMAPSGGVFYNPVKIEGYDLTSIDETGVAKGYFRNMQFTGDFYNTRWTAGQNLYLSFDNVKFASGITSGTYKHKATTFGYAFDADGKKICVNHAGRKYVTNDVTDLVFGEIPMNFVFPEPDGKGGYLLDESDTNVYEIKGAGFCEPDPKMLGDVVVTAAEPINNGVIVELKNGSEWTVTGSGHITALSIEPGCAVNAPGGKTVSMTVNGEPADIAPGNYRGLIAITVA